MSQLITAPQISVPAAQLPVTIDYPAALALRQMAIVQDELPISAGPGSDRPAALCSRSAP
jgi:hypothetical protein